MRKLLLLLLAMILAACSIGPKDELSRNQDKWEGAGIKNYNLTLFVGCFCVFTDRMPLAVEVRDGKVVSMTYSDGEVITADDPQAEFFNRFSTIDQLFADLKSGPSADADEVQITYDPTYGYPTQVNVDQIKEAVDDEYSVQISDFQVVE